MSLIFYLVFAVATLLVSNADALDPYTTVEELSSIKTLNNDKVTIDDGSLRGCTIRRLVEHNGVMYRIELSNRLLADQRITDALYNPEVTWFVLSFNIFKFFRKMWTDGVFGARPIGELTSEQLGKKLNKYCSGPGGLDYLVVLMQASNPFKKHPAGSGPSYPIASSIFLMQPIDAIHPTNMLLPVWVENHQNALVSDGVYVDIGSLGKFVGVRISADTTFLDIAQGLKDLEDSKKLNIEKFVRAIERSSVCPQFAVGQFKTGSEYCFSNDFWNIDLEAEMNNAVPFAIEDREKRHISKITDGTFEMFHDCGGELRDGRLELGPPAYSVTLGDPAIDSGAQVWPITIADWNKRIFTATLRASQLGNFQNKDSIEVSVPHDNFVRGRHNTRTPENIRKWFADAIVTPEDMQKFLRDKHFQTADGEDVAIDEAPIADVEEETTPQKQPTIDIRPDGTYHWSDSPFVILNAAGNPEQCRFTFYHKKDETSSVYEFKLPTASLKVLGLFPHWNDIQNDADLRELIRKNLVTGHEIMDFIESNPDISKFEPADNFIKPAAEHLHLSLKNKDTSRPKNMPKKEHLSADEEQVIIPQDILGIQSSLLVEYLEWIQDNILPKIRIPEGLQASETRLANRFRRAKSKWDDALEQLDIAIAERVRMEKEEKERPTGRFSRFIKSVKDSQWYEAADTQQNPMLRTKSVREWEEATHAA